MPEKKHIRPNVLELSFKDKKQVADGTTEVTFDTSGKDFSFIAGQYVRITIPELSKDVERGNTRDFTIASSPNNKNEISIAFRDSDSPFKTALLKSKKGDIFIVQGSLGVFTLPEDASTSIVMIAGGIGMTPFLSMIRFVAEENITQPITFIYTNSSQERAAYLDELKEIANKNSNITLIDTLGRVDASFIREHAENTPETFWYLCGSPEMTSNVSNILTKDVGVSETNIRFEEYVGYYKKSKNYKILQPIEGKKDDKYFESNVLTEDLIEPLLKALGQSALVAITDAQGSILYINQKFIDVAKYSKEELIGQNHRILKSGFHAPEFYKELWKVISGGVTWRGEIKNKSKDGTFYWVDTSIAPVLSKDGKIDKYIAIRFLITEKKELEADLESRVELRTQELEKQVSRVKRLNKSMVGRELKMVDLKEDIVKLKKQLGKTGV